MRRAVALGIFVLTIALGAPRAFAGTILPSGFATILPAGAEWEYTFTDPTGDPNWWNTGTWSVGLAPFGNCAAPCWLDPAFSARTFWGADGSDGDDLWLRREIDLAGYDLASVAWGLAVDNGFTLYVNGHVVDSRNHEGFANRSDTGEWEYPIIPSFIPSAFLQPGSNVIALAIEDHGGYTAFDMEITGQALPVPVPEPSPAILLLNGLVIVGAVLLVRRRRT